MAQFTVIIEVLVAQGKGIDSLFEQFQQRVVATCLTPSIGDRPGNGLGQPQLLVELGQEGDTAIAGDVAAAEIRFNFTAFNSWKFERCLVAFCYGGIFVLVWLRHLYFQDFSAGWPSAVFLSPS